ncbi:hypothetical protein PABY_06010 [Pyrodictium abyssi]|uniref:Transposase n=1 Tax=Pyrodictium abyssi TaxID=54256 RepID=A0ABN6ZLC2_9CREN|nr:hypothetical protein PABY_06010 [Pyrodictium abyssi]
MVQAISDLAMAIDVSVGSARAIAVVAAREHILKSRSFQRATTWVKHFRELGSDRKRTYLAAFPRRFEKTKTLLELARVCLSTRCAQDLVDRYNPVVVLVDDKLYNAISHRRKIAESRVREAHRRILIGLADSLANYARVLLEKQPRRLRGELLRLEK